MARGKTHLPSEASRGVVTALVGFGIPQDDIALYLKIDPKTLRKSYRDELDSGRVRANAAVIANFFKVASGKKGSVRDQLRAATFWLEKLSGLVMEPPVPGAEADDLHDVDFHAVPDDELARIALRGRRKQPKRGPRRPAGPLH